MASPKTVLQEWIGRFVFRSASVNRAEDLGPRFRRLVLGGAELRNVRWTPGDKLQIFLPGVGTRTYTPLRWDSNAGETELVAYLHGDAPGAQWARSVQPGASVQAFGPRGSLEVGGPVPAVVFGDETSLGLALANGAAAATVLEVDDASAVQPALDVFGFQGAMLVPRQRDDAHIEAIADALLEALRAREGARLVFSGRAAAIQGVRKALKRRGVNLAGAKAKAYWAPGKVGLD
jgi:NADPH-dependent ferric siderophore reductase